ncbi:hypothetical protein FQN54_002347 [Arachnomyces sp. PD_36]|nr:hypothetical protein FQN54_002347 [Arachnomyces sp. PD_36]
MASTSLESWAVPRLSQLLPIDEESLTQIVTYTAGLSKDASAEHLKNLLGDSPAALEFISSFNSRRHGYQTTTGADASGTDRESGVGTSKAKSGKSKKGKTKAGLHSAGPPRRPENFGDTAGGYVKSNEDGDYMASLPSRGGGQSTSRRSDGRTQAAGTSLSSALSLSQEPVAHQRPKMKSTVSPYESSAASSRNQSPAPLASKAPPSASGSLISDYLPNVKSKAARGGAAKHGNPGGTSTKGSGLTTTTNSIADLTAAIAALEVSTNPASSKERKKCGCNASLHPLFTPAPNCLKCGKIICSLEGLQPCSFCGSPILDSSEVQDMIKELRMERGNEKMRAHNEGRHYDGGSSRPASGASEPADNKLDAAKAHRDKLLAFQAQNAQRTRVVDETADFETPNVGSTQWMSPAQRALALKKQQRVLRDMEERARPEWERNKTVMSLDIKGGKVVRTYQKGPAEVSTPADEEEPEEIDEAESSGAGKGGRGAFGRNPLLHSGSLVRPVWKAPESKVTKGADGETLQREKKQTWRRVQDDNDDNEQWILDGGIHGYEG